MNFVTNELFEKDLQTVMENADDIKRTPLWKKRCADRVKLTESFSLEQRQLLQKYLDEEEEIDTEIMKRLYSLAFKKGFQFALDFMEKPNKP